MELMSELRKRCIVNKNIDGDRFVGVKADSDDAVVYFPIGYQLPDNDRALRQDIMHLISVLSEFTSKTDKLISIRKFAAPQTVHFPVNAYMEVINYFFRKSYYAETEYIYKESDRGKVDWSRTIKKQMPLIQKNGSPVYTDYIVKSSTPNTNNLITNIHKFCVYESFDKLGWLFTPDLPEKPTIKKDSKLFLTVLRDRLNKTNLDEDKNLFKSMIAIIEYLDEETNSKQFYFGTDSFEYVWEKLVDQVFGEKNKLDYFPKTKWHLNKGKIRTNSALEPDTIMINENNVYVLDAKYYRYGITGNPQHLPNSSSINKQITYGEYISSMKDLKKRHGENATVYNAFIMPYNSQKNVFNSSDFFLSIGEATGDWKGDDSAFERVQGILVDTRYLMHNYTGKTSKQILELANTIQKSLEANDNKLPDTSVS